MIQESQTFNVAEFEGLTLSHLEALGAECVLTWEHLVLVTQLLQADGALQQFRQVHSAHLLIAPELLISCPPDLLISWSP